MKQNIKCQKCGLVHEIKIPWWRRQKIDFIELHCICGHLIEYKYVYKLKRI